MGLLDKLTDKARLVAADAKKTVEKVASDAKQVAEKAATEGRCVAEKVVKEGKNIADKAIEDGKILADKAAVGSKELTGKAIAQGQRLYDKAGMSASELSTWAATMPDKLRKMADDFDAEALWDKLAKTAVSAGQELIVMVLTIYYALESKITGIKKIDNKNENQ